MRIHGSIGTVGADVTVTCRFTVNSGSVFTSPFVVPLPQGRVGWSTTHWDTKIQSMYVQDRT